MVLVGEEEEAEGGSRLVVIRVIGPDIKDKGEEYAVLGSTCRCVRRFTNSSKKFSLVWSHVVFVPSGIPILGVCVCV